MTNIQNDRMDYGEFLSLSEIRQVISKARKDRDENIKMLKGFTEWDAYLAVQPDLDEEDLEDLASTRRCIALTREVIKLCDSIIELHLGMAKSLATCIDLDHKIDACR